MLRANHPPPAKAHNWTDLSLLGASFIPAAVFTWGIHEYAHYGTGMILGYEMWISPNRAGPTQGHYDFDSHAFLIAMAGPLVTWIQAFIALAVIRWSKELWTYSFLFLPFWMRTLAWGISHLTHPNDEAAASLILGMPMWLLPSISVSLLAVLIYFGNRTLSVGWKGNAIAYLAASLATAAVVFIDQRFF